MSKKYHPSVPKVGDAVRVLFDDHTEDMDDVVLVEAFGRVSKITSRVLVICGWDLPKETDVGNGQMKWALARGVIRSCRTLDVPPAGIG
jgi:hypothetical protein|tara:strand:+ start:4078 stop:4344 length:267 start_codon:yes stop_codon:yes gene_type:complete